MLFLRIEAISDSLLWSGVFGTVNSFLRHLRYCSTSCWKQWNSSIISSLSKGNDVHFSASVCPAFSPPRLCALLKPIGFQSSSLCINTTSDTVTLAGHHVDLVDRRLPKQIPFGASICSSTVSAVYTLDFSLIWCRPLLGNKIRIRPEALALSF